MTRGGGTIWELVREAAETLPEPFSRAALIDWISKRRPDVELSSISTHIQYAVAEAPNRSAHSLGTRPPLLERVDRGLYRRFRGPVADSEPITSAKPASVPSARVEKVDATSRVLLVGCSRTKRSSAAPARLLFEGHGFGLARDYAIRSGDPWFILSAKYGLLSPDDVVGPYDVYLRHQPSAYRTAWGEWVVAQLSTRLPLPGTVVEVHASEAYSTPLREPLRRLGAELATPLNGLRQGERLIWTGYRNGGSVTERSDPMGSPLMHLLDPANALTPAALLAAGPHGLNSPGLYTWWVDAQGAADLSRGASNAIGPGFLYAGKAGGARADAAASSATLWSRVAGNHLRGNVRGSTLRRSLAALLDAAGVATTELELTAWMHDHLRVALLPLPSADVPSLEEELILRTDPPLNLAGVAATRTRSALSRLRGLGWRRTSLQETDRILQTPEANPMPDQTAVMFERRIRADLDGVLASGYRPTIFQRMLADHGALETARRLLAAKHVSDGFQYLWERGLLQHSVEAAVLSEEFQSLFTDSERAVASDRLRAAGYR